MQSPGREPSMEEILASIKKVIAEEKELRAAPPPRPPGRRAGSRRRRLDEDVLELDEPLAPPIDLGPPLLDEEVAEASRQSLDALSTVAADACRRRRRSTRSRRWSARCSGRSSSNGSTSICRGSSTSMSSARSRGSPAARSEALVEAARGACYACGHEEPRSSSPRPPPLLCRLARRRPPDDRDRHAHDASPRRAGGLAGRALGAVHPVDDRPRRRTSATTRCTCST